MAHSATFVSTELREWHMPPPTPSQDSTLIIFNFEPVFDLKSSRSLTYPKCDAAHIEIRIPVVGTDLTL